MSTRCSSGFFKHPTPCSEDRKVPPARHPTLFRNGERGRINDLHTWKSLNPQDLPLCPLSLAKGNPKRARPFDHGQDLLSSLSLLWLQSLISDFATCTTFHKILKLMLCQPQVAPEQMLKCSPGWINYGVCGRSSEGRMGLNGEIIDLNDIVHCNHLGFSLWAQSE